MTTQPHLQPVPQYDSDDAHVGATTAASTGGSTPPSGNADAANRPQKSRADRSLPTDRLSLDKQVEALKALGQISGNGQRPVTAEDQSTSLGLKGNTGGLSNRFFCDAGWAELQSRGNYIATDALVEFRRHQSFQPDDLDGARSYLVATARNAWFWTEIEHLVIDGAKQPLVLHALSKAAGALDHASQLSMIVQWLEWLGMVQRDGEILRLGPALDVSDVATTPVVEEGGQSAAEAEPVRDEVDSRVALPTETVAPPAAFDSGALVSFNFSVRITADDAARLDSDHLRQLLEFAERLKG